MTIQIKKKDLSCASTKNSIGSTKKLNGVPLQVRMKAQSLKNLMAQSSKNALTRPEASLQMSLMYFAKIRIGSQKKKNSIV